MRRASLALCALCSVALTLLVPRPLPASDDDASLLKADAAAFGPASTSVKLEPSWLDPDLVWTDSFGETWNKSQVLSRFKGSVPVLHQSEKGASGEADRPKPITTSRAYGYVGIVQESAGKFYILRVWVKRAEGWRLLIYQVVGIGTPPSASPEDKDCENPCKTVPFEPHSRDEADVIHAYQAVERAVAANDSKAWGAHIADEFFAVTSNSDRPLDKATRMAGLDKQKAGGIAPFPIASARMFEFGDAMVMISTQQPLDGHPLHVTRVWFKRDGTWLEAYSYQTTVQADLRVR